MEAFKKRTARASLLAALLMCLQGATAGGSAFPSGVAGQLKAFSGHVAVLPAPAFADLSSSPTGRILEDAGLAPHLFLLSPGQFADTNFFTARRFPVALHLGFESYFQNVRQPGDGDVALRAYLAGGGTLLVLPTGPFPMFYNEKGQPANGAATVGILIGAGGFEQPPPGARLNFRANTNQSIVAWPASTFPFPAAHEADQRWRPSRPPSQPDVRYTPLATLFDDRGGNHGEGAALLEFTQGPRRGGRVVYVWCSLLPAEAQRAAVLAGLLRWALADRPAQSGWLHDHFDGRSGLMDDGVLWSIQAGQWKLDQGTLVGQDCVSDAYEIKGAARGSEHWRDYGLTVRFKIESRASDWRDGPWIGVRCRADGDGYYLTFTDRECQLHKVLYGISTSEANPLARAPWKPDNAWHTLTVTAQANRLKAELDGRRLFEVKDDAHLNLPSLRRGGFVLAARKGSRSQGSTVVRFDDVAVRLAE